MTDDSSFGKASADSEPQKLFRQGATCNTFLVRYYGKLVLKKEIRPEYADNVNYRMLFRKEFDTGFALDHPAFPRYISQGEHDGKPYILEDYVDGDTLTDFLKSHPGYFRDRSHSEKFARQLLSALRYLHQHQILFLDLKPDNILITRIDHDVRLVDLGFAFVAGYPESAGLTPSFAAPEQRRKQKVDERTDIWLYGRMLQYAGVPPIYNKVVARCMRENPDDRFSSMEQLQACLPTLRRRKLVYALSSVLLLLVVGLSLRFIPSARQQKAPTTKTADSTQLFQTKQPQPSTAQPAVSSPEQPATATARATTQQAASAEVSASGGQAHDAEQQRMLADLHRMLDRAFDHHLAVMRDSTFPRREWAERCGAYDEEVTKVKNEVIRKYRDVSEDYITDQWGRYISKTAGLVIQRGLR